MSTRVLDPADLAASLAAAQADLLASPPGTAHRWLLRSPAALDVTLAAQVLGDPARSLALVGEAAPGTPRPVLRVDATAAAAAVLLTGDEVEVRGLDLRATGGEELAALAVHGGRRAGVVDCAVRAQARRTTALEVRATGVAELLGVHVADVRATTGAATGVHAGAPDVRLHRVDVEGVDARETAVGVRAAAADPAAVLARVTLSHVRVGGVVGAEASGVVLGAGHLDTPDPEAGPPPADAATAVDVTVHDVRSRADTATARGLHASAAGTLEVRGLTVTGVQGAAATGVDVLVGGRLTLSGATVRGTTGAAGGAAGISVRAGASPAALELDDLHVEAVFAPGSPAAVRGLEVAADVSEFAPWLDERTDAGPVHVTGCVLRRVSGTALAVGAELRDVEVRGVEVHNAARAGRVGGERVAVVETTWHRVQRGLATGPCTLTLLNSLATSVAEGPALEPDAETDLALVRAALTDRADPLLDPLPGGELPYVAPGPTGVPASLAEGRFVPEVPLDLSLRPSSAVHTLAADVPGDLPGRPTHVGAHPPARTGGCDLRDPLVPPETDPVLPPPPGPVLDRTTKDGRGLLQVMRDRAAVALPGWSPDDAADLTTTLLELVAHRLDRLSHAQDAALTEAYLMTAHLRRSVEEHARLVDHRADPGLSATTMLEVRLPDPARLGLHRPGTAGFAPFVVAAETVVVNPDATEDPVIVSTEEDLVWRHALAEMRLLTDVPPGAVHALLAGDLEDLRRGRWLVLRPDDPREEPHVVRVTRTELGTDTTLVWWDPRRPAPRRHAAGTTRVLGNVVPAHHGLLVRPGWAPDVADPDLAAQVAAVASRLDVLVDAGDGGPAEVPLPLAAVSRIARGWPFPGAPDRDGTVEVDVAVDGEAWRHVPDVATESGEVFTVAADAEGGSVVVLGQPGALPRRTVHVSVAARLGVGRSGNVGAHTLTSLVALGPGSDRPPDGLDLDGLRAAVLVDNPVRGVGGRDPEPLDRIRRRAPRSARTPLTAVAPADHARLLEELPEVAAARARVLELGERRLVRTTLLLRDEAGLVTPGTSGGEVPAEADPLRDAERLRRWSLARRRLEEVRLLGFDVQLVPPVFVPVDLDVVVDAHPWAPAEQLHRRVTEALSGDRGLFDPTTTGLGGDVHVDAVIRRVTDVDGVAAARVRRLRRLAPSSPEHAVDGLLPVGDEEVAVLRRPYGDGPDGLLTVEVCGGVR